MKWIKFAVLVFFAVFMLVSPSSIPIFATNAPTGTVTKGLIGEQDIHHYSGANNTFTRLTSQGALMTLTAVGTEVDVLSAYGGGINRDGASINLAITAINAINGTAMLVLRPGNWTSFPASIPSTIGIKIRSGANVTIGANTAIAGPCVVEGGGKFINGGTHTLAFSYPVQAGSYQIFDSFTLAEISGPMFFHPQWFGANQAYPLVTKASNYTVANSDYGTTLVANNATGMTFTLPAANGLPLGWWIKLKNIGAGNLTIAGTLDGANNAVLSQYDQTTVFSDAANFFGALITAPSNRVIGSANYVIDTTGNMEITGLGFQPKQITLMVGVGSVNYGSIGVDDGTNHVATAFNYLSQISVSNQFSVLLTTGSGAVSMALVSAVNSDGFTLTWSKIGSPSSANARVVYIAVR